MALLTTEIGKILKNNGHVVMASSLSGSAEPGSNAQGTGHVDYQFKRTNLTVSGEVITLTREANDTDLDKFNCVNIITNTSKACLGDVRVPGYVYTDSFSGCVFYLYQNGPNQVTGVHAHQGLDTKTQTIGRGLLAGLAINSEVRNEYSPQDFMLQKGRKMLCRHETRGVMTDIEKSQMCFLAFLSCVELDQATTYLYCYKATKDGLKVGRLIETYVDKF